MIYLLALLIKWIGHALVPTMLALAAGTLVMLAVWWFGLRPRQRPAWKGWLILGLVTVGFGGWRTWEVWRDFFHPEFSMFRRFVANPIPGEIEALAPASGAPVMFHDGAYISFRAPPALVERLVTHSLAGARTLAVVAEMKQQSGQDSSNRVVIAAPDGRSYLKVGLEWVALETSPESQWARAETERFLKSRQGRAHVLVLAGAWGQFSSVLTYEPASSNVVVLQYLVRRR